MRKVFFCLALAFVALAGSKEASAQIVHLEGLAIPFMGQDTIWITSEFEPGRSRVTDEMKSELRGILPEILRHISRGALISSSGTYDTMLWRGVPANQPHEHERLNALIGDERSMTPVQYLTSLSENVDEHRFRHDKVLRHATRSVFFVALYPIKVGPVAVAPPDLSGIRDTLVVFARRIDNLEKRADDVERRVDDLEKKPLATERVGEKVKVTLGLGYSMAAFSHVPYGLVGLQINDKISLHVFGGAGIDTRTVEFPSRQANARNVSYGASLNHFPFAPQMGFFKHIGYHIGYEINQYRYDEFGRTGAKKQGPVLGLQTRIPLTGSVSFNLRGSLTPSVTERLVIDPNWSSWDYIEGFKYEITYQPIDWRVNAGLTVTF